MNSLNLAVQLDIEAVAVDVENAEDWAVPTHNYTDGGAA